MDKIIDVVPKIRYAVRTRHTQNGEILSANSFYISLNEDAALVIGLINGSRTIRGICEEVCRREAFSHMDEADIEKKVLRTILEVWKTGLFLEGDLDLLAPHYLYGDGGIVYIPYYAKAPHLCRSYCSPMVNESLIKTVDDFSENFGSSSVVIELFDDAEIPLTQLAFVRTIVKDAYFLYAIFGVIPSTCQWKRIQAYMYESDFLKSDSSDTNNTLADDNNGMVDYLIYSTSRMDRQSLPPTVLKGVLPREVEGDDVQIREIVTGENMYGFQDE